MDIYFCIGVNTALGIMALLRLHQIAAELKRQRPRADHHTPKASPH